MRLILCASSSSIAEGVTRDMRRDGFLARASCRGSTALVIVYCITSELEMVVQRVQRCDPTALPYPAA
jgi:hypothetical protein